MLIILKGEKDFFIEAEDLLFGSFKRLPATPGTDVRREAIKQKNYSLINALNQISISSSYIHRLSILTSSRPTQHLSNDAQFLRDLNEN